MESVYICPECSTDMIPFEKNGVIYDVCPDCGGMFFNYGEMLAIVEADPSIGQTYRSIIRWDDTPDHGSILYCCPECGTALTEKEYSVDSGIHIDFCENCFGVYLNKNEIDAVKTYLASQKNSDESKQAMERAERLVPEIERQTYERIEQMRTRDHALYDELKKEGFIPDFLQPGIIGYMNYVFDDLEKEE